jgi:hypothetical protein
MDESQVQSEEALDYLDKSSSSRFRPWIAPVWFLLGVLVGVLGFALFATLAAKPAVNTVVMREAARDGTLDAIATLQAGGPSTGGPQPESRNPDPPATQKAFAVREANRVGVKSARVTIVEFSDFQ